MQRYTCLLSTETCDLRQKLFSGEDMFAFDFRELGNFTFFLHMRFDTYPDCDSSRSSVKMEIGMLFF